MMSDLINCIQKMAFYRKSNMIECSGHVASFGKGYKYCQKSEM